MAAARLQRVVYLLSSFGVGHVAVNVIKVSFGAEHLMIIIEEFDFGLIWHYSSKTSPKLGL